MGQIKPLKPRIIRVLIVDDHPLFRDGLQRALEFAADIHVIGSAGDGSSAIEMANQLLPEVVLLDINLPSMNGLQVARHISLSLPQTRIVFVTAYHDEEQVLHAFRSGAVAYCPKHITPDGLIKTIRDVSHGYCIVNNQRLTHAEMETWLHNQINRSAHAAHADADEHLTPLSPREMEILVMITKGLLNKQIGVHLGISEQTVKNHITSILRKLNVQDRTQAAVTALRRGWVRIEGKAE